MLKIDEKNLPGITFADSDKARWRHCARRGQSIWSAANGHVIQEVNKQRVKSAKDLVAASKKLKPNEKILIGVYSQGRSGYVALEPK